MEAINQFRGLPRQVYLLSIVRTIMAMGTFVFTFISLIASSRFGMSDFQIGNIMLLVAAANVFGSLSGGKLADLFGRKRVFLVADACAVVLILLAGVFSDYPIMLAFLILSYAGSSMTLPVIAALITDESQPSNRAECFSILYLSQNIGYAIGPSIGGLLFYHYMKLSFYAQGTLYALSGLLMLFLIHDQFHQQKKEELLRAKHPLDNCLVKKKGQSLVAALVKRPVLIAFLVALVILTACYQEISFILPLQFSKLFGIEAGSRYSGFLWSVNAIVCVTCTPLITSVCKKRNQLLNIAIATVFYSIGFGLNGMVHEILLFYGAVVVWTCGEILISTGSGVFIATYAPDTHRARFQSLYEMARGLGRGIGPNVFGMYLMTHSYSSTWRVISLICMGAVIYLLLLYGAERKLKGKNFAIQDEI